MLNRTNVVLAVALAVVVTLTAMSRIDYSRPNIEVLPDMKYTPAWTSFSPNPNFGNDRTLQAPVAGTIARGAMPLHYGVTKEEAVRAGEELLNPFTIDIRDAAIPAPAETATASDGDELVDAQQQAQQVAQERLRQSETRGSEVYRVFCISCHGATGLGDGPVPQRGFPPPPSLLTGASRQMQDGQLFHLLTYGQANMPNFAAQLPVSQRWDVINHIRKMQQSVPAPTDVTPLDVSSQDDANSSDSPKETSAAPETTEPEVTEPEATEPEATEPEATEPEATEPEVTEPEVTEPEVTEPEATEPEVTEPEVTEPEVTEPEVTEPEVTEPETGDPKD